MLAMTGRFFKTQSLGSKTNLAVNSIEYILLQSCIQDCWRNPTFKSLWGYLKGQCHEKKNFSFKIEPFLEIIKQIIMAL